MKCIERPDAVQANGKKIHMDIYETDKSHPVVLFIPGMGCYAGLYGDFLRLLAERGFNVIGMDPPGHGRSEGRRGIFTFSEVMGGISDVVSYATERYNSRIGILGSSLGGTYALYASMNDDRIKSAMCHCGMDISKDLHVPTRMPTIIRLLTRHFRDGAHLFSRMPVPLRILVNWHHVVDSSKLLETIKRDKLMVWHYSLGSWLSFMDYNPVKGLKDLSRPLKIIVGDRDRLFTPAHCRELAKKISPKGSQLEIIPGGHFLLHEYIPETLPVVVKWFKETLVGKK